MYAFTQSEARQFNYYYKLIKKLGDRTKPLSSDEEQELAHRIQGGDKEAAEKLVVANLRYAVSVALEYKGRGVPIGDLIGLANLGLLHAAHRFKPGMYRFISYAIWWMRQLILLALDGRPLVRIPDNKISKATDLLHREEILMQTLGRFPDIEETAKELNISRQRAAALRTLGWNHVSLDNKVLDPDEDEEGETYLDRVKDITPLPDEIVNQKELSVFLNKVINNASLTENEKKVVWLFFRFIPLTLTPEQEHKRQEQRRGKRWKNKEIALEDVGTQLNLTRERIRQIKEKAICKIRRYIRQRPALQAELHESFPNLKL